MQLTALLEKEEARQQGTLDLIASENYASFHVRTICASAPTNKYAEGYPHKRYYAGCEIVDEIENLAIERCKQLFGAEHVNVQPHAGSQANNAVYFAVLKPGDTVLGMSLAEGGHLTHGHPVNFSGSLYKGVQYKVDPKTGLIDMEEVAQLAREHKPKLIIAGASAYSRIFDFKRFGEIAREVGALFLADIAHISGLVAAGLHPNPFPHADIVTSTTHKTLRGPRGGLIMCKKELGNAIDKAVMPGTQGGPFMHIIAAKAAAFYEALQPEFKTYQAHVIANAQQMVQTFKKFDYHIITDGTDNHLFVVDLRNKNLSGHQAEIALDKAGITTSRSCIPFDPAKPWITSGIRIGTPAMTTRGMKQKEAEQIVQWINEAIMNHTDDAKLAEIRLHVQQLCNAYPAPMKAQNNDEVAFTPTTKTTARELS